MMSLEANVREVLDNLLPCLQPIHGANESGSRQPQPIVIGLSGLQGSGKSTWASAIVKLLSTEYGLQAIQISLDDLYKTHKDLVRLSGENKGNELLKTRGQPGTHDEELAGRFFEDLRLRTPDLRVPVFDKSRYNGEGDRSEEVQWPLVPHDLDVVVFEGWCVGFQPLSHSEISRRWQDALQAPAEQRQALKSTVTLPDHRIEHLQQINANLERYCQTFMGPEQFDCFVHLDTEQLANVYTWRLEQEQALIKARGSGMTEEQVIKFVRGYMPAYEMYLDRLRSGLFSHQDLRDTSSLKKHVHVCLGSRREVLRVETF